MEREISSFFNVGVILLLLIFTMFDICTYSEAMSLQNMIYVDDDNIFGPWDGTQEHPYQHIQEAIDSTMKGDIIFVSDGFYQENIYINFTLKLIGEENKNTIIDAGGTRDVIFIGFPANKVTITGFTIQNSGNTSMGGAIFDAGMEIHSDYNVIKDNIISNHPGWGIRLWASKGNNISYNLISRCKWAGIDFIAGPENFISHNVIYKNDVGISLLGSCNSRDNILTQNVFLENNKGLAMYDSGNQIFQNNFYNNRDFNAMSHFNFWQLSPSRNIWGRNYWDDWIGFGPKWIPGFLGFNFDWQPMKEPYPYLEVQT